MRAFGSDAIALSSPDGRMSKVARKRAEKRVREHLFGDLDFSKPAPTTQDKIVALMRRVKMLRDLAARGMGPRKHIKEAKRLEALAEKLQLTEKEQP